MVTKAESIVARIQDAGMGMDSIQLARFVEHETGLLDVRIAFSKQLPVITTLFYFNDGSLVWVLTDERTMCVEYSSEEVDGDLGYAELLEEMYRCLPFTAIHGDDAMRFISGTYKE